MKVLIIEDEEHYGEFLKKILQKKYSCDRAKDGTEAKLLLYRNIYDIILYDLRLPGTFGRDLIKYVRTRVDPDIINIVVTGYEQDWPAVEATEEDVFFYLQKGGFRPEELLKVVDNAAQIRQLKQKESTYIKNLIASEKLAATGKLAVGIAHEINNPLQSMLSITELMKKKLKAVDGGQTLTPDLTILEKGISRIKGIVKQLIDLHRIDYTIKGTNQLSTIVERVVSFLRPIAKEKNTTIIAHNTLQNTNIYVSESQFFHVLLNICMNLLDYKNETITIETEREPSYVVIQVRTKKRKSSREDRADEQREGSRYTESLGLEISKSIVHHLGGAIRIGDNDNGECVIIRFPFTTEKSRDNASVFT
jgi:signal transduction histidine kinase